MKRLLIAAIITLLWAAVAFGQTTVNLSVSDVPDGQSWNNGTWAVKLIPAPGNLSQTNSFTLTGAGSTASQSGSLSSTGTASFTLPANANIAPLSFWQFTVCSQQGTACSIANITITTSSPQSVTISPPSIRVAAQPNLPPVVVYTTAEISSASIGSQITVVGSTPVTPALQTCTAVSGNACTTWTAGGGVPGQFSVKAYGAVGDAKKSVTTTLTNTLNTITDTANPFLASDVGKFIFCIFPGDGTTRLAVGTKISTFVNAGSITVSNNATGTGAHNCIWYTQKETTAFITAGTAAKTTLLAQSPGFGGGTILGQQATIVCPPGGYVVDGVWLSEHFAAITLGVNFQGAGRSSCIIYQSPDITATNSNLHIDFSQVVGVDVGNFTLDCSFEALALVAAPMRFANTQFSHVHDITIAGCGTSGDASGKFFLTSFTNSVVEQIYDNTGSTGNIEPTIGCSSGCGNNIFRNIFSTNPGAGATFAISGGAHTQTGGFNTIIGGAGDEGSTTGPLIVTGGADVQVIGTSLFAGTTTEVSVDGTSTVRLEDVNLVPFAGACGVGQTRNAITIASGGIVTATNSTIQGCGATGAVSGPAGATFVDIGGNDIRNCPATGGQNPCALVTPATFATLGYTGGIVPKSTQTHTPNTCYAVTGNLLATAQNLCSPVLDQNYQLLTISAQSGGTTPTNSNCATPPVITLSDGTRSATMTMTSGKTQWSSAVDSVTNLNQIFASAATLTVSIGANTCATPPANVSVTYSLQSALNP